MEVCLKTTALLAQRATFYRKSEDEEAVVAGHSCLPLGHENGHKAHFHSSQQSDNNNPLPNVMLFTRICPHSYLGQNLNVQCKTVDDDDMLSSCPRGLSSE